jgi:hypothetical protein
MRVQIKTVDGFEGPAVQYTGSDGYPAAVILPVVVAETADGRFFQLPNSLSVEYDEEGFQYTKLRFNLHKAKQIADAALTRGFINAENWVEVTAEGLDEYFCGAYAA